MCWASGFEGLGRTGTHNSWSVYMGGIRCVTYMSRFLHFVIELEASVAKQSFQILGD